MAEQGRIERALADSQIVPSQRPQGTSDYGSLNEDFVLIPREEGDEEFDEEPAIDYDTQYVVDAKPPKDNYGQGPSRSTRVAFHKFVPNLMGRAGIKGGSTLGTVYVRFQPNMQGKRANDVYKYKNVPENVYNQFAQSNSKGRFINTFLNNYPYSRTSTREDRYHVQDFYD